MARSPSGGYYEIAASKRGDLLAYFPERGPWSWFSGTPGVLGLVGLIANLLIFRGQWRILIREARHGAEFSRPVLYRRNYRPTGLVTDDLDALARQVESGHLVLEGGKAA